MSTLDAVCELLAKKLELERASLDPSAPFDQLGIDSLSLTECMFLIEDRFDILIDNADANVRTPQELADMIDRRVAARSAATSA